MAKSKKHKPQPWFEQYHVGIAAEGFVTGALAQCGYEVLVQYGANQPRYDIIASRSGKDLRIDVKGSKWPMKGWKLTAKTKENTFPEAFKTWKKNHRGILFAFVYFKKGLKEGVAPDVYIASVGDITKVSKLQKRSKLTLDEIVGQGWEFSRKRMRTYERH